MSQPDAEPAVDPELAADLAAYQAQELERRAELGDDPEVLHPGLLSVGWLLGRWRGEAVMAGRNGQPDEAVTVTMVFDHDGAPALRYASRTTIDGRVLDSESGWWRVTAATGVEAVIAHAGGVVEVSVGEAAGGRVELGSDLVARTQTGEDDRSYRRLYGRVEGRLLFAVDVGEADAPIRPRISGALDRLPDS